MVCGRTPGRQRSTAVFCFAGDEDANLTTLCAFHHQRGVHAGVLRIAGRAPAGLVFELPLGRFRAGDRRA
jgi:hypothetical protein